MHVRWFMSSFLRVTRPFMDREISLSVMKPIYNRQEVSECLRRSVVYSLSPLASGVVPPVGRVKWRSLCICLFPSLSRFVQNKLFGTITDRRPRPFYSHGSTLGPPYLSTNLIVTVTSHQSPALNPTPIRSDTPALLRHDTLGNRESTNPYFLLSRKTYVWEPSSHTESRVPVDGTQVPKFRVQVIQETRSRR